MKNIFLIGPLPPPVGGFSVITKCVYDIFSSENNVVLFNRSRGSEGILVIILKLFVNIFKIIKSALKCKPDVIYIALSGGGGQLIDILFMLTCRLFCKNIIVHHHSFSYVNKFKLLTKVFFIVSGKSVNIVLCRDMWESLRIKYRLNEKRGVVISNAFFLKSSLDKNTAKISGDCIVVGFLSNLTNEKGLGYVLDLAEFFHKEQKNVKFIIAGPLDVNIEKEFYERINCLSNVNYLGAVYGEEKWNFYLSIDVFVFPSVYSNEAEPLVVLDAMAFSIPVLTSSAGCLKCIVDENVGLIEMLPNKFTKSFSDEINNYLIDGELYAKKSIAAKNRFSEMSNYSESEFSNLLKYF